MDNEDTRLINNETTTKGEQHSQLNNARKSNHGRTMAAVGGFAAGAAAGVGGTAFASTKPDDIPTAKDETAAENETATGNAPADETQAPAPEDVILANDEGIRYAHVEADNFNEAFAQARAQVGAGGVFEYNGKLYGTYYADEWEAMSPQERADYQNRVSEVAPEHQPTQQSATPHPNTTESIITEQSPSEPIDENAELISNEPVDNDIRILGVEAVQNEDGQIMNVALVDHSGDQALLVDIDNDGTIDVLLHDDNYDGQVQESEIHDISDMGLEIPDLQEAYTAEEDDTFYAVNDDMPDYINDADVANFV